MRDLMGDAMAALGAIGLAVLGLVAVAAAALLLFVLVLSQAGGGDDLKLPLCTQAQTQAQCWGVGSEGTFVITYGELTATDPGYDEAPRRISREQALDELNIED